MVYSPQPVGILFSAFLSFLGFRFLPSIRILPLRRFSLINFIQAKRPASGQTFCPGQVPNEDSEGFLCFLIWFKLIGIFCSVLQVEALVFRVDKIANLSHLCFSIHGLSPANTHQTIADIA